MYKAAILSEDKKYRYSLTRRWADGPCALFIMLNPSTADADRDDPTIMRCIQFAANWGCGGFLVGNLFAVRATTPANLFRASDPVGPENHTHIQRMLNMADPRFIVCAWGAHGQYMEQGETMLGWIEAEVKRPRCLGKTKDGFPNHPLFLPYSAELARYKGRRR